MNKQPEVRAKTKKRFIDAFWEICKEKNISQISVGELSRQAGYNRSTFYEYFTDIPTLLREIEDEMMKEIKKTLLDSASAINKSGGTTLNMFHILFNVTDEHMYYMLGPNGDPAFFGRLKSEILPDIQAAVNLSYEQPYLDYIVAYAYSAIIGYMQYWDDNGRTIPEEEVLELGYKLVTKGIFGVLLPKTSGEES